MDFEMLGVELFFVSSVLDSLWKVDSLEKVVVGLVLPAVLLAAGTLVAFKVVLAAAVGVLVAGASSAVALDGISGPVPCLFVYDNVHLYFSSVIEQQVTPSVVYE